MSPYIRSVGQFLIYYCYYAASVDSRINNNNNKGDITPVILLSLRIRCYHTYVFPARTG